MQEQKLDPRLLSALRERPTDLFHVFITVTTPLERESREFMMKAWIRIPSSSKIEEKGEFILTASNLDKMSIMELSDKEFVKYIRMTYLLRTTLP